MLSPNIFEDLDAVVQRLADFKDRYNQTARPFQWKFTTDDLAEFLDRLDRHRPPISTDPAQPRAPDHLDEVSSMAEVKYDGPSRVYPGSPPVRAVDTSRCSSGRP